MCELFAASIRYPTNVSMSLETFADRGGRTGNHRDGWGVAVYEGRDCAVFRETSPAAGSALARVLRSPGVGSNMVLSHIRYATEGEVSLRNTHPFAREVSGRVHVFAHNGKLPGCRRGELELGIDRPVGETDSEFVFCAFLRGIRALWSLPDSPSLSARREVVTRFAARLRTLGPANFIYADSEYLFAHGHRRTQADGTLAAPGLWRHSRSCDVDANLTASSGFGLASRPRQVVSLFASVPLTDEAWLPLAEGEIVVARAGAVVA